MVRDPAWFPPASVRIAARSYTFGDGPRTNQRVALISNARALAIPDARL